MPIGAETEGITPEISAQAVTEGAILGLYTFNRHISKKSELGEIEGLTIIDRNPKNKTALLKGINTGKILAEAANLARDMVNEPSNYMTPTIMAAEAKKVADKNKLAIEVLERKQMKELGMGALLGVTEAGFTLGIGMGTSFRSSSVRRSGRREARRNIARSSGSAGFSPCSSVLANTTFLSEYSTKSRASGA